jgi:hypothetical protein
MRPYFAPDKAKQCREDLDAVERAICEVAAPVAAAEAEISKIRQAIERGNALKKSDFAKFLEQGGENLIFELERILPEKLLNLEKLRAEIANLQQPLQITKSNLLAFLAKKREKSQIRKEREELLRVKKESPINLFRWVSRVKMKPSIWKVVAMAQRREDQILSEICDLYHLKIVSKKDLSDHYARKYADFRLKLYRRGYYLIPDDQPKGREKETEKTSS